MTANDETQTLTRNQTAILLALSRTPGEWQRPTDIGVQCGARWSSASAFAVGGLSRLERRGLVERGWGEHCGRWRITNRGLEVAHAMQSAR